MLVAADYLSLLGRAERLMERIERTLPGELLAPDWDASIAFRYSKRGSGHGKLEPIANIGRIGLSDLQGIDAQRDRIQRNTEQFVMGLPANNVLLTGARGTGKSSLIRACLHTYAERGLRLIEVEKSDLIDLPYIVELVSGRSERFVIFCDDLSFDEGEAAYKALKSVLDGSVAVTTPNVLIYATSNRRHLLPEYLSENLASRVSADGEVHPNEAIEEKVSLSDRFGVWISFYPFGQDEYLKIVAQWLAALGVDANAIAHARGEALIWALERGSRSGRTAWQFALDFAGRNGLSQ